MRKRSTALATFILTAICLASAFADKLTIDPNVAKASASATQAITVKPDERLAQKLTYAATDKRLHSIVDDISKQTGVAIYCGKTNDDWKTRDLPLVVCVNELPLGKLLQSIADATHLTLTSFTIKDQKCYRFAPSSALEQKIADYEKQRYEAGIAQANWEWDSLVKLASMPDSETNVSADSDSIGMSGRPEAIKEYARVLAALPPDAKKRVFAGEKLTLRVKDLPVALAGCVEALYRDQYKLYQQQQAELGLQHPEFDLHSQNKDLTDAQVKAAYLSIELGLGEFPSLCTQMGTDNGFSTAPACEPGSLLDKLKDKLPERPKEPEPPKTEFPPNLERVGFEYGSDENAETFKIEKPTDRKVFTPADYVGAFAKVSGYSIICEDFESHKQYCSQNPTFGPAVTFNDGLQSIMNGMQCEFYSDATSKLLVGFSHGWNQYHKRLAPESVLVHLRDKLNGDGVELDDAAMIRGLSDGAYYHWILDSRELQPVAWATSGKAEPFWKLYDALSAEDKALAKSESGLPLIKLNSDYVTSVFRESAKGAAKEEDRDEFRAVANALQGNQELNNRVSHWMEKWVSEHYPALKNSESNEGFSSIKDEMLSAMKEQFPELKVSGQIPTDPSVISKLTLFVTKQEMPPFVTIREETKGGYNTRTEKRSDGFKKHLYLMTIKGEGVNIPLNIPNLQFPVYSVEREAELWKEMQKKSAENTK